MKNSKNAKKVEIVETIETLQNEIIDNNNFNIVDSEAISIQNSLLEKLKEKLLKSDNLKLKSNNKEKNYIYRIEERTLLTERESKQYRAKIRNQRNKLINQIVVENLKKENLNLIPEFLNFYKETYILNNFTFESMSKSNDDDLKDSLNLVFILCQKYLSTQA